MKKIFILSIITLFVASCKKQDVVDLNAFKVTMVKTPLKAGDTAFFTIQGNPDFITYYSGEKGKNYSYRSRISAENSTPQLAFTSFGEGLSTAFPNSLSLMLSTNYTGDSTAINSATWNDITNRAVLSNGTTNTASGTINLNDFRTSDSVYIGFRYKVGSSATNAQPTWTIQSFNINNLSLPDSTVYNVRTIGISGWQTKDIANSNNKWAVTSTQLKIAGGPINASPNEDWAITKVSLKSVNPDLGTPIKNISERVSSYFYKFATAGTYRITFLASDKRNDLNESVIQQFDVTVN